MSLPVFVVPAGALDSALVEVVGDEGRHAAAVRRIRTEEHILLTDGQGNGAECRVRVVGQQGLVAEILVRRFEPVAAPRITVVQAIPKGEHAHRAVDLLTEVGVDEIVPWAAVRAVVSWDAPREAKALSRWRATAQAAAKQSRRLRFPVISDLHSTAQVASLLAAADLALVLHEEAVASLATVAVPECGELVLVVGPEGGVTDEEVSVFAAAGAQTMRIGPTVLRTSSAGMAACAALLSRTPRWA
ncbi:MAG: 16S rRNA (uracil(1498)-N(3))-methyltransferase [Nocardioidaceae bacterium]